MLTKYKNCYEKISMGLLSLCPEEKDVKRLQETIKKYETETDWQLYLWREESDFVGIVGIQKKENESAILEHICVNPSYRNEGVGKKMLDCLNEIVNGKLEPANDTINFFLKWNLEGKE